ARGRLTRLVLHNAIVTQLARLVELGCLGESLRELAITRTRSTPLSLPEEHVEALAAADLRSLTSLSLCGYDLRPGDVPDLLRASWVDQLHTLVLRDCRLKPYAANLIVKRDWPRLAYLDLRGSWLGPETNARLRERFGNRVRYSS